MPTTFRIVTKAITKNDKNLCKTWFIAKKEESISEDEFKRDVISPLLEFFDCDLESIYGQFRDVVFAGSSYTSINVLVKLRPESTKMYRVADIKSKLGTCMICPIVREENNEIIRKFFARRFNGYDIFLVDVNPHEEYINKFVEKS